MTDPSTFLQQVQTGYSFKSDSALIGVAMLDGKVVPDANVSLPYSTMNRHGLIAGATGTGKTKTLQVISEHLSDASIPVVLMDIKGDLSGLAAAGAVSDKLNERIKQLGISYQPTAFPVELFTLTDQPGVHLRATVTEFGPILLSRILGLNDTQGGLIAILFKYSDDNNLPLVDLKDLIKLLQYAGAEGKTELEKSYGRISTSTTGTILRKVIELQQQGADVFFGEKSFDVNDLIRIDDTGRGMISILRVNDLQDRPKLFSTFMLQLLAELYATLPEEGDLDKPKLVLFIDEAHLVFQEASDALLQQIETVVKLIRSKGIGVFFCTQNPMDIPPSVLAQLGLKIQHSLRAFTAADRKMIKQTAENYPTTEFYDTDELITKMGIGEAMITMLNEKGIPTPLVHTLLVPPRSRMDVLTPQEINEQVTRSKIAAGYNEVIDRESAYEMLNKKIANAVEEKQEAKEQKKKPEKGFFDNPTVKQVGRTAASVITRSLLGALGLGSRRRRLF